MKIEKIAGTIYGANGVVYSAKSKDFLQKYRSCCYPVCIAKTEKSLSDDKSLLGCPKNFRVTINDMKLMAGAGMIVAYAGNIMTMPGLPRIPRATQINVTNDGVIVGLN